MAGRHLNKMTTLTPDTHKIASSMDNFSGWLRARLRQFDEGVDLVALEMSKDYLKLQFKNLSHAIDGQLTKQASGEIWILWNDLMLQSKLGDFE